MLLKDEQERMCKAQEAHELAANAFKEQYRKVENEFKLFRYAAETESKAAKANKDAEIKASSNIFHIILYTYIYIIYMYIY